MLEPYNASLLCNKDAEDADDDGATQACYATDNRRRSVRAIRAAISKAVLASRGKRSPETPSAASGPHAKKQGAVSLSPRSCASPRP